MELDAIVSVTQKRWGSIWVAFIDQTTKKKTIGIAKTTMNHLMDTINTYKLMRCEKPLVAIYEVKDNYKNKDIINARPSHKNK